MLYNTYICIFIILVTAMFTVKLAVHLDNDDYIEIKNSTCFCITATPYAMLPCGAMNRSGECYTSDFHECCLPEMYCTPHHTPTMYALCKQRYVAHTLVNVSLSIDDFVLLTAWMLVMALCLVVTDIILCIG